MKVKIIPTESVTDVKIKYQSINLCGGSRNFHFIQIISMSTLKFKEKCRTAEQSK